MREFKRIVTMRDTLGNDVSIDYIEKQYDSLDEVRKDLGDAECLDIINKGIREHDRRAWRSQLDFKIRLENYK